MIAGGGLGTSNFIGMAFHTSLFCSHEFMKVIKFKILGTKSSQLAYKCSVVFPSRSTRPGVLNPLFTRAIFG